LSGANSSPLLSGEGRGEVQGTGEVWPVAGHDGVVSTLAKSLEQGRLSHACLFLGPKGVGKGFLALNLAAALNCAEASRPCGACVNCRKTLDGKHPDVHVIRLPEAADGTARKLISIDQIKDLQQTAGLQPFLGAYRVFIIDGAEQLSVEAANRLLKTLEEPPANVVLALLASDERALLPTVLSRCRVYRLRPVPRDRIAEVLVSAHHLSRERARLLAGFAEGSIGWAIAAAKDEELGEARSARVGQIAELAGMPYHERLAVAGRLAEDFSKRRDEAYGWLDLLRQYWRDVLLLQGGARDAVVNADRTIALEAVAKAVTLQDAAGALRHIRATIEQLERNANPRLALDVLMLHLPVAAGIGTDAARSVGG